jgi:hypothetical protein
LLYSRTVRRDFFHEFDFIFGFLFCPELFGSWSVKNMKAGDGMSTVGAVSL